MYDLGLHPDRVPSKRSIIPILSLSKDAFSTTALEMAIKQVVRENCTHSECAAKRSKDPQNDTTCTHEDLLFRDGRCTKT
jgi:hypothetical protein